MLFKNHSELSGKHAFLSPSNYHWLNYDEQKLEARYYSVSSARRGTDLHDLAHEAIRLGIPLADSNLALATYVNDALYFGMVCEQPLFYSDNCFGTADTISFKDGMLRIHDLKTGITNTSEKQLEIYSAIFCLEYSVEPFDIETELRIYQRDEVRIYEPTPDLICEIMDKIVHFDNKVQGLKEASRW